MLSKCSAAKPHPCLVHCLKPLNLCSSVPAVWADNRWPWLLAGWLPRVYVCVCGALVLPVVV